MLNAPIKKLKNVIIRQFSRCFLIQVPDELLNERFTGFNPFVFRMRIYLPFCPNKVMRD
jgi:hypothetical protein